MNARRQVDLDGSISGCDAAGRSVQLRSEGSLLTIDADSVRAALSALSALRASGAIGRVGPQALERLNDFRIELCVRGHRVGRAGAGARAGRLASAVAKMPLELSLLALLKASLTSF